MQIQHIAAQGCLCPCCDIREAFLGGKYRSQRKHEGWERSVGAVMAVGKRLFLASAVCCSQRAGSSVQHCPFVLTQLSCLFILASRPRGQQRCVYRNFPNSHSGMRTKDTITKQEGSRVETREISHSNSQCGGISIKLCTNIPEVPLKRCGCIAEMLCLNAV